MVLEAKTAQLRIKPNRIIAEGTGGTIFWATPARARLLIDAGAVVLMNAGVLARPVIGPGQTKPAGASETKEPVEKKSSAADPAGRLTDSAPSSGTGPAAPLFASAEDPALPKRRSRRSSKPET